MGNPHLLLLDEPSEGLAPVLVEQLSAALRKLKSEGVSMLLCEQNLRFAETIADRACVLEGGHLRFQGTLAQFERDADAKARYLGV
jgi:branched-chain amino acid transport system ATP-binding protein